MADDTEANALTKRVASKKNPNFGADGRKDWTLRGNKSAPNMMTVLYAANAQSLLDLRRRIGCLPPMLLRMGCGGGGAGRVGNVRAIILVWVVQPHQRRVVLLELLDARLQSCNVLLQDSGGRRGRPFAKLALCSPAKANALVARRLVSVAFLERYIVSMEVSAGWVLSSPFFYVCKSR